jgi:hypothetical protein
VGRFPAVFGPLRPSVSPVDRFCFHKIKSNRRRTKFLRLGSVIGGLCVRCQSGLGSGDRVF